MEITPLFAIAYLLGSIPFGLILTKFAGVGDIRKVGSGNIGATNVMRTGRKGLAAATLLLDMAKGFAAVWLARYLGFPELALTAGIIAILGHMYPIWLKFKGGKGVATAIGVYLGFSWLLGALLIAIWLITFLITRISSLGALASLTLGAPIATYIYFGPRYGLLSLMIGLLIAVRHKENIRRLMKGEENIFKKSGA